MSEPLSIRRSEILASLSLATDLAMGQPLGHFLHTTLTAVAIAEAAGLDRAGVQQVHEVGLLRMIGCTGESPTAAYVMQDEVTARGWIQGLDYGSPAAFLAAIVKEQGKGLPMFSRLALIARTMSRMPVMMGSATAHCEIAALLAARMGFLPSTVEILADVYERWDGKGLPGKKKGEDIPIAARIVYLADDLAVHHRIGGPDGARQVIRGRSGRAYDPRLCALAESSASVFQACEVPSPWTSVLEKEPEPVWLDDAGLDEGLLAMADFTDLKSYATTGHSRGVADLAAEAARRAGLPAADVQLAWRAGLLHDLGKVAVSTSLWDKPGPLTDADWEAVRLHPYQGERCLARSTILSRIGAVGTANHERNDGTGYPKGLAADGLSPVSRLLAVADAYRAMVEDRPHRKALGTGLAAAELHAGVAAGQYDGASVVAVLSAAGHAVPKQRRSPAGLSEREVEVLRLLARGHSNKEIAAALFISPKTVDNHLQHVYTKLGVTTRAAAAVYAADHNLLADDHRHAK